MQRDRILRIPGVLDKVGNPGRSTLYRWIRNGEFPKPLQLGGGSVGWRESVVDQWIDERPVAEPRNRDETKESL
jgi:prophage regulatory protein